jgi:hypothetical protein
VLASTDSQDWALRPPAGGGASSQPASKSSIWAATFIGLVNHLGGQRGSRAVDGAKGNLSMLRVPRDLQVLAVQFG